MSLRSPKARYCASIHLDKARGNIGGDIYTSNNIDELKRWCAQFAWKDAAHVEIKENLKKYPEFEWVPVESYDINKK